MHVGNDVDTERDHVAQHRAHFVIALAFGPAGLQPFDIDFCRHDLDVDSLLGKKTGFLTIRRDLNMAGMPTTITHAQFHASLLKNFLHAIKA